MRCTLNYWQLSYPFRSLTTNLLLTGTGGGGDVLSVVLRVVGRLQVGHHLYNHKQTINEKV